jgi:hypothetical protein
MTNESNSEPLTSAEWFLLIRLLQHLENEGTLPEEAGCDWQVIYAKLNEGCRKARKPAPAKLVLDVIRRSADWECHKQGYSQVWACGPTAVEAIGKWMLSHEDVSGIKVVFPDTKETA